jgi:hypothetical protein
MARTETAGNLITRAKERADMENSNFISTAEWYRSLNVWTAQLWNHLVKVDPDRYTREQTLTATGSTQDFEVADDYYGTVGIDYISDAAEGIYVPIPRLYGEEETRIVQNDSNGYPVGYTYRYNVSDPSVPLIRILPTTSYNCRHRYIVTAPEYATDGTDSESKVIGISGFEEFVVIGMAIDARIKEESSVVQLRESHAQMLKHLEEMAENRSIDSAGHVHDSRRAGWIDPASYRWGTTDY